MVPMLVGHRAKVCLSLSWTKRHPFPSWLQHGWVGWCVSTSPTHPQATLSNGGLWDEAEGSWAKTFTSDLILKKICNFNDKNFSELNILSPPKESSEKELKAIGNSRKAQGDQRANM